MIEVLAQIAHNEIVKKERGTRIKAQLRTAFAGCRFQSSEPRWFCIQES